MKRYFKVIVICILCLFFICINTISFSSSEIGYAESHKIAFSMDDIMEAGDNFLDKGDNNDKIKVDKLQDFSKNVYSILLVIGIALSIIIGIILGIKYMISSVSEKASVKEMILIYVISCVVIFGGFGIWKLMVEIMESI